VSAITITTQLWQRCNAFNCIGDISETFEPIHGVQTSYSICVQHLQTIGVTIVTRAKDRIVQMYKFIFNFVQWEHVCIGQFWPKKVNKACIVRDDSLNAYIDQSVHFYTILAK